MKEKLIIEKPSLHDSQSIATVFESSIRDAFVKEGLGHLEEDIVREIDEKKRVVHDYLNDVAQIVVMLVAKIDKEVVGTISFGPCSTEIQQCTGHRLDGIGELGSLYITCRYQRQGIGSLLIDAMVRVLDATHITQFCLDCGYTRAQQLWIRKFGEPYHIAKDYWGSGNDHMVWLCNVREFLQKSKVDTIVDEALLVP